MSHDSASQRLARLSDHFQGQTIQGPVMLERNFTSAGGATPALFGHVSMVRSPKCRSSPAVLSCRNEVQTARLPSLTNKLAKFIGYVHVLGSVSIAMDGAITSISGPETLICCEPESCDRVERPG